MSRKHFSWLLFLTFLIAATVLLVPGKTGRESSFEQLVFLPGLASSVNDIEWLRLTSAGGVVIATLRREGTAWVVEEASGYRADWSRLKTLLAGLSQAEVIEAKTANPEYYERLGVEDVESLGAGGVLIEFSSDSGLPALIIGKTAQGREGQYARLRDSAQSALLDRRLDLPTERSDWLDKNIIDISDEEVVEVRIDHADGESVRVLKASADDENFELQDIPTGREIKSDWSVNALAGALASLDLEYVVPEADIDWNGATRFSLLTADGLMVDSELVAVETDGESAAEDAPAEREFWIRLQAGLYTTAVSSGVEAEQDNTATTTRAEAINKRLSGWAYQISSYKSDAMSKRKEDLLEAVE